MAAGTLETKAHELVGQLNPGKLADHREAVADEDSETLSPAEAKAIAEADEWSKHHAPISHEQVLAEFGLSMADWEKLSREP